MFAFWIRCKHRLADYEGQQKREFEMYISLAYMNLDAEVTHNTMVCQHRSGGDERGLKTRSVIDACFAKRRFARRRRY